MFSSTPRAPLIEASSSKGDEIASCVASMARFSPRAKPVPINAIPIPCMIVRTSAKSRLINPGTVIKSLIPCTACRSTSSAVLNASVTDAVCATAPNNRSFGIVITVSTDSCSSLSPCSACCKRRRPSKLNGLVTTATVKAPSSVANEATIGAPPVPVPPPRPVVTKTMSAPSSTSIILSVSSSAACRPTSGSAPAPSPLVSRPPSWIFTGARERFNACRSVFATTNSMPSMPVSIMRLTALPPPPPTPMTFMRAPVSGGSSSRIILMPLPDSRTSGVMGLSSLPKREVFHGLFRLCWAGSTNGVYILRTIYCAVGRPAYNTLSKNTTKTIAKLGHKMRQASRPAALRTTRALFEQVRALRHQRQPGSRSPGGTLNVFDETAKSITFGITNAHGSVKNLLGDLDHAIEQRASAGEHDAARQLPVPTRVLNFIGYMHQHFFGARLQDVAKNLSRELARRPAAYRRDFDHFAALIVV